jgi:3-phenylpropionate/cinnamic acid dioxygenase small subunit
MVNNNLSTLIEDEHQIACLLTRWGHARDSDDWQTLAACFHEDATIHISWISGPVKDFISGSRAMAAARKPGEHIKHLISGPWIQINRERAFSRCHANLYIRTVVDGHEFDLESWIRFFDLLEKRDSVWRIVKRTAVYEKDRLEPVDPRGVPKGFFDDIELSAFPGSAKFLCYWQVRSGRSPSTDIISVHTEKERVLRQEGELWLEKT